MKKLIAVCVFALVMGGWASVSMADPGRGSSVQCYVWANVANSTIGAPYTPSALYSYNAVGRAGANLIASRGRRLSGDMQGSRRRRPVRRQRLLGARRPCPGDFLRQRRRRLLKVQSWTSGGADFSATVRCYDRLGAAWAATASICYSSGNHTVSHEAPFG